MKKYNISKLFFFSFLMYCCFSTNVFAQKILENCGADQIHANKMANDAEYSKRYLESEEQVNKRALKYYQNNFKSTDDTYTIPVVVHIMHNSGDPVGVGSNISDQNVIDAIQFLNNAFTNANGSVETGISFCLASVDPNGNATTGITRYSSTQYANICKDTEDNAMKAARYWDQTSYMNIYVVDEIYHIDDDDNDDLCNDTGVGGYAYPSGAHGQAYDGIVVENAYIATGVLPHEVGHYFNLKHTFQGGCNNNNCLLDGDRVCDTPPDNSTEAVSCANSHTENSCSTDVNSNDPNNPFTDDQDDMTTNFMDYNYTSCLIKFTDGQKVRMHDAINNDRASLLDSNGCCPTDWELTTDVDNDISYEASDYITTTQSIDDNITVSYDAGNYISLNPGFNTGDNDNVVIAFIDGCGGIQGISNKNSDDSNTGNLTTNVSYKTSNTSSKKLTQEIISNYPNPFNNSTTINFSLDKSSNVSLKIFDSSGREIANLIDNEQKEAGNFQVNFDGGDLTSGIYFYTLHTNKNSITKKMMLHK